MKSVNGDIPAAVPAAIDTLHLAAVMPYEDRLAQNPEWALTDASLYFEDKGAVRDALRKITAKLRELDIDYAVVGGMACSTMASDDSLKTSTFSLRGKACEKFIRASRGSAMCPRSREASIFATRSTESKSSFLIAGDFPGDGKPKPVAFPDPKSATVESEGIKYINLATFIEMKIASGMTSPQRPQDMVDAQRLIEPRSICRPSLRRISIRMSATNS